MCEKWRSEHETELCHCYGPSNVRRLCCLRKPNKKELGTCQTTGPSALSKATAFWSWGFPASCQTCTIESLCSWSPYPFENMVASDHTFMMKNSRLTLGCLSSSPFLSCRFFNVHDHTFGYHVLPHAGRGYSKCHSLRAHCLLGA